MLKPLSVFVSTFGLLSLVGCSAINDKIADWQTRYQKHTLPDGRIVSYNTNVSPTPAWNCLLAANLLKYNAGSIKMQGQFHAGGYNELLMKKAAAYIMENKLTANYVNIIMPTSYLLNNLDLSSGSTITLAIYQCEFINPDRKAGATNEVRLGIS